MGIFSKLQTTILGLLALLMPLIYLFGRKAGKDKAKANKLANDLVLSNEVADFYKALSDEDDTDPVSPDTLVNRLRSNGL